MSRCRAVVESPDIRRGQKVSKQEEKALIDQALKANIENQDWERMGGNLAAGLAFGASIRIRLTAARALGDYRASKGDTFAAITAYEHGRILARSQAPWIEAELSELSRFVEVNRGDLSQDDLLLLLGIVEVIIHSTPRPGPARLPKKRRIQEFELPKRIEELIPDAPKKTETKFTFRLVQLFNALDPSLTPDERFERVSKILAPHILRTIKEKRKQSGTSDQGGSGTQTPSPKAPRKPKK